jgi:Lanthionine-containing peptide SapB precursor RamS
MALLDLQALEVSSELSGGYDCDHGKHDHSCGSGLSLLLCG